MIRDDGKHPYSDRCGGDFKSQCWHVKPQFLFDCPDLSMSLINAVQGGERQIPLIYLYCSVLHFGIDSGSNFGKSH
jgi:hypothetical protein